MGAARMAEHGNCALHFAPLEGLSEGIEAMPSHEPLADPGAVSDEVDAAGHPRQGGLRKLEAQPGDKLNDPRFARQQRGARQAEEREVIDVAAVAFDAQHALDEMVERVEIDQRVELRQQIADGYPDRLAV